MAEFTFEALDSTTYLIQSAESLLAPEWITLDTFNVNQGGIMDISIPIDLKVSQRFFRLFWDQ